jgi:hypothetical protein
MSSPGSAPVLLRHRGQRRFQSLEARGRTTLHAPLQADPLGQRPHAFAPCLVGEGRGFDPLEQLAGRLGLVFFHRFPDLLPVSVPRGSGSIWHHHGTAYSGQNKKIARLHTGV